MVKSGKILLLLLVLCFCFSDGVEISAATSVSLQANEVMLKSEKDAYKKFSNAMKKADYETVFVCDAKDYAKYKRLMVIAQKQSPYDYGTGYSYGCGTTYGHLQCISYYGTPKKTILKKMKKADQKAEKIAKKIKSQYHTAYARMKAAHDYLCHTVEYDYGSSSSWADDKYTAYGALIKGRAVCNGYSAAYDLILEKMGINCIIVRGDNHAWNMVLYNGKVRYVDVTWDDVETYIRYDYFLKSSSYFSFDHEWDSRYYTKKHLSWQ